MGPGGGRAVVDDLHELLGQAPSRFGGGTPVFLFGHSLGSLIALAYLPATRATRRGVLCGFPVAIGEVGALGAALRDLADSGMRDEVAADLCTATTPRSSRPARSSTG